MIILENTGEAKVHVILLECLNFYKNTFHKEHKIIMAAHHGRVGGVAVQ